MESHHERLKRTIKRNFKHHDGFHANLEPASLRQVLQLLGDDGRYQGFPPCAFKDCSAFNCMIRPIFLLSSFVLHCVARCKDKTRQKGVFMPCRRCKGLLVAIPPLAWESGEYQPSQDDTLGFPAWKCVNCGYYEDALILANRMAASPFVEVSEASPEALVA